MKRAYREGMATMLVEVPGFLMVTIAIFVFFTGAGLNRIIPPARCAGFYIILPLVSAFPTAIRGYGAGFAASFAKIGAVLTAFLFPILLKAIGTQALLLCLIAASLLGAVATWVWRVETRGALKSASERIQPQI